jgi:hypothetical protein
MEEFKNIEINNKKSRNEPPRIQNKALRRLRRILQLILLERLHNFKEILHESLHSFHARLN